MSGTVAPPSELFVPWGWSRDIVRMIYGSAAPKPSDDSAFREYRAIVQRDIKYQCVVFARHQEGLLVVDCCDASDWECEIREPHVYLKMQYNPGFAYRNNTLPFTYLAKTPEKFAGGLDSMRVAYTRAEHDLPAWGRFIAVSMERWNITVKMRELGLRHGGQFCLCSTGYDDHERRGLLDPEKPREAMPWDEYFRWMCRARAVIDARGFGEFTHRMVECLGIGVPLVRPRMHNQLSDPLVPWKHYLDCGPDGINLGECLEILKCDRWRESIIRNGLSWYSRNATPSAVARLAWEALRQIKPPRKRT